MITNSPITEKAKLSLIQLDALYHNCKNTPMVKTANMLLCQHVQDGTTQSMALREQCQTRSEYIWSVLLKQTMKQEQPCKGAVKMYSMDTIL